MKSKPIAPWVAVDLDGTLAEYHEYINHTHIGAPIPKMVQRVREWIDSGVNVKIFTARVAEPDPTRKLETLTAIAQWSLDVFGVALPVTCIKDYGCVQIWDDRAVQIIPNTGERADGRQ
jgi:histidinol phosphatase-like enzyme